MKTRDALLLEIDAKAPGTAAGLAEASDAQVRESAQALGIALEGGQYAPVAGAPKTRRTKKGAAAHRAAESADLDARTEAVRMAVQRKWSNGLDGPYNAWARVVFDDHVIVTKDGKLYSVDYTLGAPEPGEADQRPDVDAIVFTSEPQEVREVTTYEPVMESVQAAQAFHTRAARDGWVIGPAREGADAGAEFTGAQWDVIVIEAGLSGNRNLYRPEVLEAAAPLYEGVPIYVDHAEQPRRFGRSATEAVGFVKNVRSVRVATEANGASSFALAGTACIVDPTYRTKMLEARRLGKPDFFGLSHDADIQWKPLRVGALEARDVSSVDKVRSVDLVMNAAAGGRFAGVTESLQGRADIMRDKLLAKLKDMGRTDVVEALGAAATDDQVMEAYDKALAEAAEKIATPAKEAVVTTPAAVVEAKTPVVDPTVASLTKRLLKADVREAIDGARGLPEVARTKLRDKFLARIDAGETIALEAVQRELKDQIEVTAAVLEAQGIKMPHLGQTSIEIVKTYRDQAVESIDAFWSGKNPMQSFRAIYVQMTGDQRVSGRVTEAARLRDLLSACRAAESLDSTSFDQIMGDSITRALLPYYQLPEFSDWQTLATVVPLNDYRTQRRIRYGGYGNLSIVGQGQPFPALTSPTDEEATYAPAKRGGTEDLTIEMIRNDDVGALRDIPRRLGRAAGQTLLEFVLDLLGSNSTIYDSVALAASGHSNIITTAFSPSNVQAGYQKLKKQTDMSSGKRISLALRHIWVPTDLQELAWQIVTAAKQMPDSSIASTAEPAAPSFTSNVIRPAVHTVDYWTDTNNYWFTADKGQAPMIEVGFVDGQDPQLYVQDQPTVGSMFSNEKLTYKIRHVYGAAVVDYRPFVGGIVA